MIERRLKGAHVVDGRAHVARIADDGRPALAFEQVSVADHERLIRYVHERHGPVAATDT